MCVGDERGGVWPYPGMFGAQLRQPLTGSAAEDGAGRVRPKQDLPHPRVMAAPSGWALPDQRAIPGASVGSTWTTRRPQSMWRIAQLGIIASPATASKQPDCQYETPPHSPSSSSAICLCRLPLPVRRHRARRPLVPALRPVLPRCRGAARRAWCRGRPCHDLPVGPAVHAAADRGCSPLPARRRRPLAGGRDLCEGRRSVAVHLPCDRSVRAGR
jgi:hypothetical protein